MNSNVKAAEGKLGVLVVGLGAVTTTFMTGVLMARKGLAKPVGAMTQYDKVRVGKGADKNISNMMKSCLWLNSTTSYLALGMFIPKMLLNRL